MNVSHLMYIAIFAAVSAFMIHAVSSLSYNTIDDTIPYKRLFWIDKKASYDDSPLYTVRSSSAPIIVDCFLKECIKSFSACGKTCIMTNEEMPCMAACNQQKQLCSTRCFQRYAVKTVGNAA
uniref:Np18 n=1 Tax=Stichopus japonicus TaxID=307972 RepID=A0A2U8RM57_STIJA|nr:np18 precursor [Apostichopus japonicus]